MTLRRLNFAFHKKLLFISDREACSIPDYDNEEVIIIGGYYTMKTVSVYSEAGWQRDLPSLNQARRELACCSYVNGGKKVNHIVLHPVLLMH